jgi:hypothetical protein
MRENIQAEGQDEWEKSQRKEEPHWIKHAWRHRLKHDKKHEAVAISICMAVCRATDTLCHVYLKPTENPYVEILPVLFNLRSPGAEEMMDLPCGMHHQGATHSSCVHVNKTRYMCHGRMPITQEHTLLWRTAPPRGGMSHQYISRIAYLQQRTSVLNPWKRKELPG